MLVLQFQPTTYYGYYFRYTFKVNIIMAAVRYVKYSDVM